MRAASASDRKARGPDAQHGGVRGQPGEGGEEIGRVARSRSAAVSSMAGAPPYAALAVMSASAGAPGQRGAQGSTVEGTPIAAGARRPPRVLAPRPCRRAAAGDRTGQRWGSAFAGMGMTHENEPHGRSASIRATEHATAGPPRRDLRLRTRRYFSGRRSWQRWLAGRSSAVLCCDECAITAGCSSSSAPRCDAPGQSGRDGVPPAPVPRTATVRPSGLYLSNCATCHGLPRRRLWRATVFLSARRRSPTRARWTTAQRWVPLHPHQEMGAPPLGKPGMPAFGYHAERRADPGS